MAQIGIRLADGQFFPILEENDRVKKRLILTTVKDGQTSVQIDVYRGSVDILEERTYVGSLVIENVPVRSKGEPDIRLDIGLDDEGNLTAFAKELINGEHQTLRVSLKALSEDEKYEIPDFDFQEETASEGFDSTVTEDENPFSFDLPEEDVTTSPFTSVEENPLASAAPHQATQIREEPAREEKKQALFDEEQPAEKKNLLLPILLALLAVVLVAALSFGLYKLLAKAPSAAVADTPVAAPAKAPEPAPVVEAPKPEPAKAPEPVPEPPKPEPAKAPEPAKVAEPAKAPAKPAEVWHKIRWGDTLWDISIAYYRTPWLYGKIAKANGIKNPNLIISGTRIRIPPR